ncbi:hypothetical protein EQH57_0068 [Dictyocoela roeselum]|nr:hypothetical protein EQH57_0068 [Dictyocoela roeselum]
MVDLFSRYTETKVIWNISSKSICKAFENVWINKHGIPKKCLTDNGRQFIGGKFKTFIENNNIIHIKTAPYNPTGNSIAERINQEIGISLRLSRGLPLNNLENAIWKKLNLTVNATTGYSPLEIFKSKAIFDNDDVMFPIDKNKVINRIKTKMKKNI